MGAPTSFRAARALLLPLRARRWDVVREQGGRLGRTRWTTLPERAAEPMIPPRLALPRLASSQLNSTCLASPRLVSSRLASPRLASLASPLSHRLALSCPPAVEHSRAARKVIVPQRRVQLTSHDGCQDGRQACGHRPATAVVPRQRQADLGTNTTSTIRHGHPSSTAGNNHRWCTTARAIGGSLCRSSCSSCRGPHSRRAAPPLGSPSGGGQPPRASAEPQGSSSSSSSSGGGGGGRATGGGGSGRRREQDGSAQVAWSGIAAPGRPGVGRLV
jgi:hypothetical protein